MDVITLGPLALPLGPIFVLLAMVAAVTISRLRARGEQRAAEDWLWFGFIGGMICARVYFVLQYADTYLEAPLSILDIRDGGFNPWAGVVFMVVFATAVAYSKPAVKPRLAAATVAGLSIWMLANLSLQAVQPTNARLPAITLFDMEGKPKALHLYIGKPVVLNIWATWCPPCQREMPVLAQAQQSNPDIAFVFANQGETIEQVQSFLNSSGLELKNVLTDPASTLSTVTKAHGLPTTLFFDSDGNLVGRRMGELSKATLLVNLQQITKVSAEVK